MRGTIIRFVIKLAIILALYFLSVTVYKLNKDNTRIKSNYDILQRKSSEAQELSKKEFKHFYARYDSLAKKLDIKTKNIQTVIVTKYRYKDTTITKCKTVIDTIKGRINFEAIDPKSCYSVSGFVSSDSSVWINGIAINDNLTTFVYQKKDAWFWTIKKFWQKPKTDVKIYSECKQDTLFIVNNINIIKN